MVCQSALAGREGGERDREREKRETGERQVARERQREREKRETERQVANGGWT